MKILNLNLMKIRNYLRIEYEFTFTIIMVFIIFQIRGLDSLFCHRCLSMNCPGEPKVCESVRSFLANEMKQYYQIGKYLETCPKPDDSVKWRQKQKDESQCDSRPHEATCILGRIRISTQMENKKNMITHATLLGCATVGLLNKLRVRRSSGICNIIISNGSQNSYKHCVEIEHCQKLSEYCILDYCIKPEMSEVRPYRSQGQDNSFEFGTIIAIIVTVVIVITILLAASFCKTPFDRTNFQPIITPLEFNNNIQ